MFALRRLGVALPVLLGALAVLLWAPGVGAQSLNQPPSVTIEHPEAEATVNGTVNITGTSSDTDGSVERVEVRIDNGTWREANNTDPWNVTWDTTLWDSGLHNITARAWDGDTYSENETINVTADQPPKVMISAPEANATVGGEVNITGTVDDPEASLDTVEVRIDNGPWQNATVEDTWWMNWDTSLVASTNHTITVRADDGNMTNTSHVNVTVDQPPSLTIQTPNDGATLTGVVNITGDASDAEDRLQRVEVRIDDGSWQEASGSTDWSLRWDTANVTNGQHTITARALDGNHTTETSVNVTVTDETETPQAGQPTVTILEPEEGATVNGTVTIEGTAEAPDGSVDRVEVRIDDGPWTQAQGTTNWTFEWSADDATRGEHTIEAQAIDDDVASPVDLRRVVVGTQAAAEGQGASLEIESPANGTTVSGAFQITGTLTGSSAVVEAVEVRLGASGTWTTADGVETWNVSLNASDVAPGEQRITARALVEDQPADVAWVTVRVEPGDEGLEATASDGSSASQAPTLEVESPTSKDSVADAVTFAGTVSDPDDDFARAEIRIDDGPWRSVEVATGQRFSAKIPVGDLEPGEHTVTVRAYDGDQLSSEQTFTIMVEEEGMLGAPGPGVGLIVATVAAVSVAAYGRSRRR